MNEQENDNDGDWLVDMTMMTVMMMKVNMLMMIFHQS